MQKQKSMMFPTSLWEEVLFLFDDPDVQRIYLYAYTNTDRGIFRPNEAHWKRGLKIKMDKFTFLEKVQEVCDNIIVLENGNWLFRDFLARTHKPGICTGKPGQPPKTACRYCQGALQLYSSNNVNFDDVLLDNIKRIDIPLYMMGQVAFKSETAELQAAEEHVATKERINIKIEHHQPITIAYTDTATASCFTIIDFLKDPKADWDYIFSLCNLKNTADQTELLQEFCDHVVGLEIATTNPKSYFPAWAKKQIIKKFEAKKLPRAGPREYKGGIKIDINKKLPGQK